MNEKELDLMVRLSNKYMKELIEEHPGKEYHSLNDMVEDMVKFVNDNDLEDILRLDQPWKESEKVRLSNLHQVLDKRDPKLACPLPPFKSGESDASLWSGVIYGAYLNNMLSLNESIDLCMELTAHGESEPFAQIRAALWEERQHRRAKEESEE